MKVNRNEKKFKGFYCLFLLFSLWALTFFIENLIITVDEVKSERDYGDNSANKRQNQM